jgi:hypothetical protein
MPNLPDGDTVTEIQSEGWESTLLTAGTFSLSRSTATLNVGESVTLSGTSTRSDGSAAPAEIAIERPDDVSESVSAGVSSDGSYSVAYTAPVGGTYTATGLNATVQQVKAEGWEVDPPADSYSVQKTEGWES